MFESNKQGLIILFSFFFLAGCLFKNEEKPVALEPPLFLPPSGDYQNQQYVKISASDEEDLIRYTLDGSDPSIDSFPYVRPIRVFENNTAIKARAYRSGSKPSSINSASYSFSVAKPNFNPSGGRYQTPQVITITSLTDRVTIRYTLDGSEPTEASDLYSFPIGVKASLNLRARAYFNDWRESDTTSKIFVIDYSFPDLEMIWVSPGSFNPTTSYYVTLSGFLVGKYEVTQEQYRSVMGTNPSFFQGDLRRPVDRVNWYDAIEFANRLSMLDGFTPCYRFGGYGTDPDDWPNDWNSRNLNYVFCDWSANGYRLPTEMEWMFAALSGDCTLGNSFSGCSDIDCVAWYKDNSAGSTHPVGGKLPNELGIYDMTGNVWEWCWDVFRNYPTGSMVNPVGTSLGSIRILRGGSWSDTPAVSTNCFRLGSEADHTFRGIGFRLVRSSL